MGHGQDAYAADKWPFWETIVLSDCEGITGSSVSANKAKTSLNGRNALNGR